MEAVGAIDGDVESTFGAIKAVGAIDDDVESTFGAMKAIGAIDGDCVNDLFGATCAINRLGTDLSEDGEITVSCNESKALSDEGCAAVSCRFEI